MQRKILLLNRDIHSLRALNFLAPILHPKCTKIILSNRVGGKNQPPKRLSILKKFEQELLEKISREIDEFGQIEQDKMRAIFCENEELSRIFSQNNRDNLCANNVAKKNPLLQIQNQVKSQLDQEKLRPKPLLTFKQIAQNLQCEIEFFDNINSEKNLDEIRKFAPDLVISIRYGQILRQEFIDISKNGVINLHSGILPNYRGVLATFRAILNGDEEIGATLHFIDDAEIDSGKIIAISKQKTSRDNSFSWNLAKLYENSCALICDFVKGVEMPDFIAKDAVSSSYFSYPNDDEVAKFEEKMDLIQASDFFAIYGGFLTRNERFNS